MYRRHKTGYAVHLYLGSLAGLTALLLHCLIDLQFRTAAAVGLYFFFILGVTAATVTGKQQRSSDLLPRVRFSGMRGRGILGLVSLFSFCCLIFQIGELRALALFPEIARAEMRMGKAGYEQKTTLLALESFAAYQGLDTAKKRDLCGRAARAMHLSPLNPRYHYIRSLCAESGGDLDRALADCRDALLLSPAQVVYSRQYGKLLDKRRDLETAPLFSKVHNR
jgi:hypothetical protein